MRTSDGSPGVTLTFVVEDDEGRPIGLLPSVGVTGEPIGPREDEVEGNKLGREGGGPIGEEPGLGMREVLGRRGDGHGRCGSLVGAEGLSGPGCGGFAELVRGGGETGTLAVGTPVMIVVTRVDPESIVLVKVAVTPRVGRVDGGATKVLDDPVDDMGFWPEGGDPAVGSDEMIGVTYGVLVGRVLNLLGGAMLSNHPVVPLTTEK